MPEIASLTPSKWNPLSLLRSGETLPSTTLASIPARVASLESASRQLLHDIAELELIIKRKHKEITSNTQDILYTHALSAPIRSLPREVLLRIFSLIPYNTLRPDSAPCVIGHVCKLWRTVSRSCPALWSHIKFPPLQKRFYCDVIRLHLVLSNPYPLNIVLPHLTNEFVIHLMLSLFLPHATRWQSLDVFANAEGLTALLLPLCSVPLKTLQRLKIASPDSIPPLPSHYDTIRLPSCLESLDISLPAKTLFIQDIHFSTLTSFTGPFTSVGSCYRFLRNATSLKSLVITCAGRTGKQLRSLLVHKNIECLTITSCGVSEVLDSVSLPSLKELSFRGNFYHSPCPRPGFCGGSILCKLVQRSKCPLQKLYLDLAESFEALIPILDSQTVSHLQFYIDKEIDCDRKIYWMLKNLTFTKEKRLLPNLRQITLECDLSLDFLYSDDTLEGLVLSRWKALKDGERLSKLVLLDGVSGNYGGEEYSALSFRLQKLQDEGLDIVWTISEEDVLKKGRHIATSFL